jgi:hypothetical protein
MEAAKRILAKVVGEEISAEEIEMVSGGGGVDDNMCGGCITGFGEWGEALCDDAG